MAKKILICALLLCLSFTHTIYTQQAQQTMEINFDELQDLTASVNQQELAQEMNALQATPFQAFKQKIGGWLFVKYCLLYDYIKDTLQKYG